MACLPEDVLASAIRLVKLRRAPVATLPNEKIAQLLDVRRFARGQLVVSWKATDEAAERKLLAALKRRFEKELSGAAVASQGALMILHQPGTENEVQIGPGGVLVVKRRFTGNVERSSQLLKAWVEKHWLPIFSDFDEITPNFLALMLDVELSAEGILDDPQTRQLIARYMKPVPGWDDLADCEFRVSKAVEQRYYLNFGVSTYKTVSVNVTGQIPLPLSKKGESGAQPLKVDIAEEPLDRGLKVQIDANTKFNQLNELPPIVADHNDFTRCLDLACKAADDELPTFLRFTE